MELFIKYLFTTTRSIEMKILIAVSVVLFSVSACVPVARAAEPARPTDTEMNARLTALQDQRNAAENQIVLLAGHIAALQKELTTLQQKAASCQTKGKDKK